jgi:hypothetical protein
LIISNKTSHFDLTAVLDILKAAQAGSGSLSDTVLLIKQKNGVIDML